jgi:outer membrane receptor protein involved in Fe transport
MKATKRAFLLVLTIVGWGFFAVAQNSNTGEIKGTVTDSTGAVVPGVRVTIANVQTGVSTDATTNSAGIYDVPSLPIGQYKITFSKAGFRNSVREGITLQIQTIGVDAALQVGATTQEIVVTAEAPLVETETSDQHVDLTASSVQEAPIVGVDWRSEMVQLIPGANTGGGTGAAGSGQQSGVNGTQGYNINFLLDGANATAPRDYNNSNYFTPVDAISEVSVNSSNAPAQYGGGLTSINVITKAGTNQFHGTAYEYIQNTAFNSRPWQYLPPAIKPKKPVEHWNNYGGNFGGPVIKNKLFFFFDYQRNPSSTPTSGVYSYPTAAIQAGNFFGLPGSTGSAFNGSGTLQGTYDPVALKLQTYFPGANAKGWVAGCPGPVNPSAGTPQTCPTTNNYIFNGSSPNRSTWYSGRGDYNINSKHKLSVTFNYLPTLSSFVPADPLFPNDATAYAVGLTKNLSGQLTEVYTITSNLLNEFRFGASHEIDPYKPPSLGKNDPATLGLEPAYGTNAPANVFPHVVIGQGAGVGAMALGAGDYGWGLPGPGGNGNIDAILGEGTYNTSDVVSLVKGRHTIKFGGEYDKLYQNYTNWGDLDSGHFYFNGGVTGIPYADFLAGDVYQWHVTEADPTHAREWTSALFVNDDVKVTPRLTLNLGLRWQIQSGWTEKHNLFGIYDPFIPNSAVVNGVTVNQNGAILYGGQSDLIYGGSINNLKSIQNANYKEFAPRIGFAWSPRDRWVVRMSYGIFDAPRDAENYTDGALGLGLNPHNTGFFGGQNGVVDFKLSQGPPAGTVVFPTIQTLSPSISNFGTPWYYPRNMPTNFIQQFLFGVQRQFTGTMMVDASYVNTRGRNLNFATNINQPPPSMFQCNTQNCGNPNPIFGGIQAQLYDGYSNYNALQLRFQKRMSYGLSAQANYSWSKSLDTGTGNGHGSGVDIYQNAFSPSANYGLSNFNAAHTLVGELVYEIPVGHGRMMPLHGIADEVVGGWRISSIFQWHSGIPFTPVVGGLQGTIDPGMHSGTLYPNLVGDPHVSNPTVGHWFNPAAFANPAPDTFGDSRRNSLVGPRFVNADLSLAKEFGIRENLKLEFRADAYNIFNHLSAGNPDANVGVTCHFAGGLPPCTGAGDFQEPADKGVGKITYTTNGARVVQLGTKVIF